MSYVIVHETILEAASEPLYQQVDAPAGLYVVAAYTQEDSDDPIWNNNPLVVDAQDRVTGVRFLRSTSKDIEGYLVCSGSEPSGTATLVAGTVAVSFAALTSSSRVFVERRTPGGTTAGNVYRVTSRTPGTGFTISAVVLATEVTGALDTSTVDWVVIEP